MPVNDGLDYGFKVITFKETWLNSMNDTWHFHCMCVTVYAYVPVCSPVDQELGFQDKYLFYRFLDDEEEDAPLPSEEEKRESEEELPETILFLAQIGPDALLRMILRKSSVPIFVHYLWHS